MDRNWERLAEKQKDIIRLGFSSGNALLCGDRSGIFFENYEGSKSADPGSPVSCDTLFHLYSMTKVFTVTSAMQLIEKGLLDLDANVCDYIPEYTSMTVCEKGVIRPAETKITVGMLLSMTSGLSYFLSDESGEALKLADNWREDINKGRRWDTLKFAKEIAKVPLSFEPETKYLYGLSHDVLGAMIEIISGESLDVYFEKHMFRPLGMNETFFYQKMPEKLKPRLAENTSFENGRYVNIPLPPRPVPIPAFEGTGDSDVLSGGSGLVGTAGDYSLFLAEMLEPKKGILKPETVEFMVRPRLTEAQRVFYNDPAGDPSISGPEHTFALGVRVQDREAASGSVGEWGWSGALGTWFFVSPDDGVWFLYMHQHSPAMHDAFIAPLRNAFYEILRKGR
ncbi:MAG: beta-lactamase family protein [Clostridia bacterium]|nr:beta-lactamase family protein [Clostridia bacterium]